MVEIIFECKEGGIVLCDHVTSLLRIVAFDICNIFLTWINESMHLGMVFS